MYHTIRCMLLKNVSVVFFVYCLYLFIYILVLLCKAFVTLLVDTDSKVKVQSRGDLT